MLGNLDDRLQGWLFLIELSVTGCTRAESGKWVSVSKTHFRRLTTYLLGKVPHNLYDLYDRCAGVKYILALNEEM